MNLGTSTANSREFTFSVYQGEGNSDHVVLWLSRSFPDIRHKRSRNRATEVGSTLLLPNSLLFFAFAKFKFMYSNEINGQLFFFPLSLHSFLSFTCVDRLIWINLIN